MAFIYKITNDINDKIYIGKTEFSIKKRFAEHCNDAFKNRNEKRPLYSAMKKYGVEHFSIELIEETDYPEEREKYWISFYNSYVNGYNATLGADGKKLFDYEQIKELILNKKTYKEIQDIVGCSYDTILLVAKKYGISVLNGHSKSVIGTHSKTKEEIFFPSILNACCWLVENNLAHSKPKDIISKISQVCNGIRHSAYGYYWRYSIS